MSFFKYLAFFSVMSSEMIFSFEITSVNVSRGSREGRVFDRVSSNLILEPGEQVQVEFFFYREPLIGESGGWKPLLFSKTDGTSEYALTPNPKTAESFDILNRTSQSVDLDWDHINLGQDAGITWNVAMYGVRVSRLDQAKENGEAFYSDAITITSTEERRLAAEKRMGIRVFVPSPIVAEGESSIELAADESLWKVDLPLVPELPEPQSVPKLTLAGLVEALKEAEAIDKKRDASKRVFRVVDPLAKKIPPSFTDIYFFTNRLRNNGFKEHDPWHTYFNFEAGRNDYDASASVLGRTSVKVPGPNRSVGSLSIKKGFPGSWDDEAFALTKDAIFYTKLENPVTAVEKGEKFFSELWKSDVTVYLHGFNVDFEEALTRAAQLKVDMGLEGPMVVLDWPSRGLTAEYDEDRKLVENSLVLKQSVSEFLTNLSLENRLNGRRLVDRGKRFLLAHSMGNEVLNQSVKHLGTNRMLSAGMFDHIIFAAPDVSIGDFEGMTDSLRENGVANKMTLYYSRKDIAVNISRFINLIHLSTLWTPSRIVEFIKGRAGVTPYFYDGLDIVNADNVNSSLGTIFSDFRHGYFGTSDKVVADIECIIRYGMHPLLRGATLLGAKQTFGNTSHYVIKP